MKNNFVDRVIDFNKTVIGISDHDVCMLTDPEAVFTVKALQEEVTELKTAHQDHDLLGCIDALIDVQVFAIGAMFKMGLDHDTIIKCMDAVCDANDTKRGGQLNKARSQDSVTDAVKPTNWVGPEARIGDILDASS